MSKAMLILLVATLGLGVVSLHLIRELRAERGQVQLLQTRLGELESVARPAAPSNDIPAAAFSVFHVERLVDASPAAATSKVTASAEARAATKLQRPPQLSDEESMHLMRESMERQRTLLQDPEYRDAVRSQQKAMYLQTYPELAKELDMNAEELDQLLNLLADQQVRSQEVAEPMAWSDSGPDSAAMEEMQRKALAQHQTQEAELAALLGSKLQAWNEYQSTLGVRHQVIQLRSMLASRGVPLQESQSKPLLKALAQGQQRFMKELSESEAAEPGNELAASSGRLNLVMGGSALTSAANSPSENARWQEQQLERMTQLNERTRDAAARVLTPQQLKIFEENQDAQMKMQQAQLRMMRAQAQAETQ
jgi:hypothetical protein